MLHEREILELNKDGIFQRAFQDSMYKIGAVHEIKKILILHKENNANGWNGHKMTLMWYSSTKNGMQSEAIDNTGRALSRKC